MLRGNTRYTERNHCRTCVQLQRYKKLQDANEYVNHQHTEKKYSESRTLRTKYLKTCFFTQEEILENPLVGYSFAEINLMSQVG